MLRVLFLLLLALNLAFFAWARGWLAPLWPAPQASQSEPERLAAQVRPERVLVLPSNAASAALRAAREQAFVCLEAGPFSEARIAAAEAALGQAGPAPGGWARVSLQLPGSWVVYSGRWRDAAALRAREVDLVRLGITFELLKEPAELVPGLVLSSHGSRAEAEAALKALPSTLRGLTVVALAPPPLQHWLRASRADADMQARLRALNGPALAGGFKPCLARPATAGASAAVAPVPAASR